MEFVPEIQRWLNTYKSNNMVHYINQMMDRSHMIITIYVDKIFEQDLIPIYE